MSRTPVALRLAGLQVRLWPRYLVFASLGLAVASAVLSLLLALGTGIREAGEAWLGEALPLNTLDVVPARASLAGLGFASHPALGGTPLDRRVLADLAALPQVRRADAVVDLPLPLLAEGGEALLGRSLRADLLVTGLDAARVQQLAAAKAEARGGVEAGGLGGTADAASSDQVVGTPSAAGSDHVVGTPGAADSAHVAAPLAPLAAATGAAAFVDNPTGPIPALIHPALLATYNATVAPSLGLPQLAPRALLGLAFGVHVGRGHLPGRVAVRQEGDFVLQVVGLSQDAQPLGLSIPSAAAERLWRSYAAEGTQAPPLARVRLTVCAPVDVAKVARRVAKMGLAVDDAAEQVRRATALAQRLLAALGAVFAALAGGYGVQALMAHGATLRRQEALFLQLGVAPSGLRAAALVQASGAAFVATGLGQVVALVAATQLQGVLQAAANAWQVQLPQAFVLRPTTSLGVVALLSLAAVAGAALQTWPRLDKAAHWR